jgi:O-antigen/teichoic acid export membrane protein
VSQIVASITYYSADLLVGILVNPTAAGEYRLANRLASGVSAIAYQPVSTMAWVHFGRVRNDQTALGHEWLSLMTILSITVWPALSGMAFLSKTLLFIVVGPGWNDAAPVLVLLALAKMAFMPSLLLDPVLGVSDRTSVILKMQVVSATGLLVFTILLARFGAPGAAAAQLLMAVVMASIANYICIRQMSLRIKHVLSSITPGLIATISALAAAEAVSLVLFLPLHPFMNTVILAMAGILAWGVVYGRLVL